MPKKFQRAVIAVVALMMFGAGSAAAQSDTPPTLGTRDWYTPSRDRESRVVVEITGLTNGSEVVMLSVSNGVHTVGAHGGDRQNLATVYGRVVRMDERSYFRFESPDRVVEFRILPSGELLVWWTGSVPMELGARTLVPGDLDFARGLPGVLVPYQPEVFGEGGFF